MIKLIASDIDGTLVKDGAHVIDPAYYDVIRELKKEGIVFCACSGRQYHSMRELFAPVEKEIYFIASNGTLIRTADRILHSWKIEPDLYLALIAKLRTIEGSEIVSEGPDTCWIEGHETPATVLLRESYKYSVTNVEDITKIPLDQVIKVTIYHPDVETAIRDVDWGELDAHLERTISGAVWMDTTSRESGKGEAFALLQEYLGIKAEETVYFGDNLNDLSAFREAGIAATVANARKEMHEAADLVAKSYAEFGVLQQLRHILDLHRRFREEG